MDGVRSNPYGPAVVYFAGKEISGFDFWLDGKPIKVDLNLEKYVEQQKKIDDYVVENAKLQAEIAELKDRFEKIKQSI
jgi:cell division protein FtsB